MLRISNIGLLSLSIAVGLGTAAFAENMAAPNQMAVNGMGGMGNGRFGNFNNPAQTQAAQATQQIQRDIANQQKEIAALEKSQEEARKNLKKLVKEINKLPQLVEASTKTEFTQADATAPYANAAGSLVAKYLEVVAEKDGALIASETGNDAERLERRLEKLKDLVDASTVSLAEATSTAAASKNSTEPAEKDRQIADQFELSFTSTAAVSTSSGEEPAAKSKGREPHEIAHRKDIANLLDQLSAKPVSVKADAPPADCEPEGQCSISPHLPSLEHKASGISEERS